MGTVTALRPGQPTHSPAVEAALDSWTDHLRAVRQRTGRRTSENTIRSYRATMNVLTGTGTGETWRPDAATIADLSPDRIAMRFRDRWGTASAATWNARRAALRAFDRCALDQGWISEELAAGLDRQHEPRTPDRTHRRDEIHRLIKSTRHPLRDRTLWALLYETFARAEEILSLNVEDLDMPNRQAWVTRKGGDRELVTWDNNDDTKAATRLSKLVGSRTSGPVFLTARKGKGVERGEVDAADMDPETGRGDQHDKHFLQPFGEYMPMRDFFRMFSEYVDQAGDFKPGPPEFTVRMRDVVIGVATCYEVAFDPALRTAVLDGAQLLTTPTNNATFGFTDMTYQQLAMSRLRAIEVDRAVVVAATSGVSAIVHPDGSVSQETGIFEPGRLVETLPLRDTITFAARYGGHVQTALIILGGLLFITALVTGRRRTTA